jgi:hypothetical protein
MIGLVLASLGLLKSIPAHLGLPTCKPEPCPHDPAPRLLWLKAGFQR